jgi:hypothetical protein
VGGDNVSVTAALLVFVYAISQTLADNVAHGDPILPVLNTNSFTRNGWW